MSDHVNGREQVLGTRKEKSMETAEKAPEKEDLTSADVIEIGRMYFMAEAAVNAAMARVADMQDHIHRRMHRAWAEAHGVPHLCGPLSEAYALLGRAKCSIQQSHGYADRAATALDIQPQPEGD